MLVLGTLKRKPRHESEGRQNESSRVQEIVFMVEEAVEGGYTAFALGHSNHH